MKKLAILLVVSAVFLLTTTLGLSAAHASSTSAATARAATPTPSVTSTIAQPLLVDGAGRRLYALVQANGLAHHIGVFSTKDGRALTTFPYTKPFALDAKGNRLFVISGRDQVTVLNAQTGKVQDTLQVKLTNPSASLSATPQYDTRTDQLLVFAGNTMASLDPKTGREAASQSFDVPIQDGCRARPAEPLPIEESYLDAERRLLYLEFNTFACTPWIGYTLVAYDLAKQAEVSRAGAESYSALAAAGGLYVESWYRFGIGTIWTQIAGKPVYRSSGWSAGSGFQLDSRRTRLYQGAEGSIRIFNPTDMSFNGVVAQPVKGELAAYDPVSDQLYFVDGATIRPFAAGKLSAGPVAMTKVKGAPQERVQSIVVSPAWQQDKTLFVAWSAPWGDSKCFVFNQTNNSGPFLTSRDGGKQWLKPQNGLPSGCGLASVLAVSPAYAKDRTLLAGIRGNGIFKSTDGGATWRPAVKGLPYMAIHDLALSPGFARDRTAFASVYENGLQRSLDGGASWQTLTTAIAPVIGLSPEYDRDGTLAVYGMTAGGGAVQLSEDRGNHWRSLATPSSGGPRLLSLAPGFARWGVMFAGDIKGDLYRSADRGASWQRVLQAGRGSDVSAGTDQMQLVYGPTEQRREVFLVVSATEYGNEKPIVWGKLYRSADGGQTWAEMDEGKGIVPTALAISPAFAQDRTLLIGAADGRIVQVQPSVLQ